MNALALNPSWPVTLLVLEDTDIDFERLQRALRHWRRPHSVIRAEDGVDALNWLFGTGGREKIQQPYLIVVDINLPRMNGFEFLEQMYGCPNYDPDRTVILSSSDNPLDVERAEIIGIRHFLTKPVSEEVLCDVLESACRSVGDVDTARYHSHTIIGTAIDPEPVPQGVDLVVVDDDLVTLDYIDYRLSRTDLSVRCFDRAEQALAYLKEANPRTMIVDHRMPEMTGLELLQAIAIQGIQMPERTYLTSAIEISGDTDAAVRAVGARFLLKSSYMNGAGLNSLVSDG
jgi:CheY-like chemotaxis protein